MWHVEELRAFATNVITQRERAQFCQFVRQFANCAEDALITHSSVRTLELSCGATSSLDTNKKENRRTAEYFAAKFVGGTKLHAMPTKSGCASARSCSIQLRLFAPEIIHSYSLENLAAAKLRALPGVHTRIIISQQPIVNFNTLAMLHAKFDDSLRCKRANSRVVNAARVYTSSG